MIQIKPATSTDAVDVRVLRHKGGVEQALFPECFTTTADQRQPETLLLREEGAPCTTVSLLPITLGLPDGTQAGGGYVYALTTDPELRGKGHAQTMMKYVDYYLTESGLDCAVLIPDPPELRPFFLAAGFTATFDLEPPDGSEAEQDVPRSAMVKWYDQELAAKYAHEFE